MRMSEEDYKKLIKPRVDRPKYLSDSPEQDATEWHQADVVDIKPKKTRKVKLPIPKESAVLSHCIQYLWRNGCFVWRNNTGSWKDNHGNRIKYGAKGSPDIVGILPNGQFIGVECKRQGRKAEPHQLAFGEKITTNNGIYIVAHSIDELADALKGVL